MGSGFLLVELLVGRNVDNAHRALLHAELAALTLLLVDLSQENTAGHVHSDCIKVAGLGTLHTADTTGSTGLTGVCTLVLILAQNDRLTLVLRDDGDDGVGAGRGTGAAAHTLFTIHLSDTVHNMDSIKGACLDAVAIAQTAVFTHTVAAVKALDSQTALNTLEFKAL